MFDSKCYLLVSKYSKYVIFLLLQCTILLGKLHSNAFLKGPYIMVQFVFQLKNDSLVHIQISDYTSELFTTLERPSIECCESLVLGSTGDFCRCKLFEEKA